MAVTVATLLSLTRVFQRGVKEGSPSENSATAISTQAEPTPPRHLWQLPREIRDLIFDHVYPHEEGFAPMSHRDWDAHEKERSRPSVEHVARRFPTHKVNDFMVSKQYFLAASGAYISNQTFSHDCADLFVDEGGIIYQWMTAAQAHSRYMQWLHSFPRLRHVTVEIDEEAFEALEPKYAWREALTEEAFKTLSLYAYLTSGPSLQTCTLIAGKCLYASRRKQAAMWERNVAAFADVVNQQLKSSKGRGGQSSAPSEDASAPLYAGSKVCFGPSNLRARIGRQGSHSTLSSDNGTASVTSISHCEDEHDLAVTIPELSREFSDNLGDTDNASKVAPVGFHLGAGRVFFSSVPSEKLPRKPVIPTKKQLEDRDIPEYLHAFQDLLRTDGEAVMEWVRYACDETCGKPLKGKYYSTPRVVTEEALATAPGVLLASGLLIMALICWICG
ncbi:hypothetical protein LTR85_002088 [Meristemomyces frigidus]|nr:hypothetical protein LTR85_002088 [Meristemomyces frigidus]